MSIYRVHYDYFGARSELSRILLQELTFYSSGKQSEAFVQTRHGLMAGIEAMVREAQRSGEISTAESGHLIARNLFFTYSAAIRWWIAGPRPVVKTGLADLRRLLQLQMDGLAPHKLGRKRPA
jgi:hypothetical protein